MKYAVQTAAHMPFLDDVGGAHWTLPGWGATGRGTGGVTQHLAIYTLILVSHARTFIRIGCEVTTAGGAGSKIRLAIYNATLDSNNQFTPGTLVLDAGTVTADSIALKQITISQTLAPGYYFLAFSSDAVGCVCRGISLNEGFFTPFSPFQTDVDQTPNLTGLTVLRADGAAAWPNPATAPTGTQDSTNTFVRLRDT